MPGLRVDLEVHALAGLLRLASNSRTLAGGIPSSFPPKFPSSGTFRPAIVGLVGDEPAVVDDRARQRRARRAPEPASSRRPCTSRPRRSACRPRRARPQVGDRRLQVPHRAVLRQAPHELMRDVRVLGDLAAVEIGRERDVTLLARNSRPFPSTKSFRPHHSWMTTIAGFFRRAFGSGEIARDRLRSRSDRRPSVPARAAATAARISAARRGTTRPHSLPDHARPPILGALSYFAWSPSFPLPPLDPEARLQRLYDRLAARFGWTRRACACRGAS